MITACVKVVAQDIQLSPKDTFNLGGQISAWGGYNNENPLPLSAGGRYIPSLYYGVRPAEKNLYDFEASANIYGSADFHPFDDSESDGAIKPYRFWMRYSTEQLELRLGLQKINFGSASLLRPLMWFDQLDPRDPLHLTDGVWALLGRYYFLNNANIWLWGLYGNHNSRGWEIIPSNKKIPEFGGRLQLPVPHGEVALSYHFRNADNSSMGLFNVYNSEIPEDRFGFDARWDLKTGFWIEGSWTKKRMDLGTLTNQEVINAGIDYTFGLGNGLYMAYEHLILAYDQKPFELANRTTFSLLTATYPAGLFDNLSAILYYNWDSRQVYNFTTWQRQFDNLVFYLMAYWNPEGYDIPAQTGSQKYFAGKGFRIMLVFNH